MKELNPPPISTILSFCYKKWSKYGYYYHHVNVIKRGDNYHFRMAVPKDCQVQVDMTEITQSLQTKDPAKAAVLGNKLTSEWKSKFRDFRKKASDTPVIKAKTDNTVADFKKNLDDHMEQHLADYLDRRTEDGRGFTRCRLFGCCRDGRA